MLDYKYVFYKRVIWYTRNLIFFTLQLDNKILKKNNSEFMYKINVDMFNIIESTLSPLDYCKENYSMYIHRNYARPINIIDYLSCII